MFMNSKYNIISILLEEITFSHLKNYIEAFKQGEGEVGAVSVLYSKHLHTWLTCLARRSARSKEPFVERRPPIM